MVLGIITYKAGLCNRANIVNIVFTKPYDPRGVLLFTKPVLPVTV